MKQDAPSAMVEPCGKTVRALRQSQGLTLDALVARTTRTGGQVGKRKLQQIEKSEPTRRSILVDVARALGVDIGTLVFDIAEATKTLIQQLYLSHDESSLELSRALLSEDLVISIVGDPQVIPFAGTYHGVEGVREFLSRLFSVIEPRGNDPPPKIVKFAADYSLGTVVVDLDEDLVRLKSNPECTLICKVKCTFQFKNGKLVFFEDLFDTAAWERFLRNV